MLSLFFLAAVEYWAIVSWWAWPQRSCDILLWYCTVLYIVLLARSEGDNCKISRPCGLWPCTWYVALCSCGLSVGTRLITYSKHKRKLLRDQSATTLLPTWQYHQCVGRPGITCRTLTTPYHLIFVVNCNAEILCLLGSRFLGCFTSSQLGCGFTARSSYHNRNCAILTRKPLEC